MTKDKRINARIPKDVQEKLEEIVMTSGDNLSTVIMKSIEGYYKQFFHNRSSPLQALTQFGFIGCASGNETLSTNYKESLTNSLVKKHDNS